MDLSQQHILGPFEDSLSKLRDNVLIMGRLCVKGLKNAFRGLDERDGGLCDLAIDEDERIDGMEKDLDRQGIELMLRYHPYASDLREVISAMKIASNLERVGDQAVSIARKGRKLGTSDRLDIVEGLAPVYALALHMLEDSLRCYGEKDVELAGRLILMDSELDAKCSAFDEQAGMSIAGDTGNVKSYINLILVSRCLERVGDHASNVAEDVIYLADADDVRHEKKTA